MPADIHAIEALLEILDRKLRAFQSSYIKPSLFGAGKNKPLAMVRFCRDAQADIYSATTLIGHGGTMREDISNHERLHKIVREKDILADAARLADLLAAVPLFDHPMLCITATSYPAGSKPRVALKIDGFDVHDRIVQLPTLIKRLGEKLRPLDSIEARGRFLPWSIENHTVHAPDATRTLLKWIALSRPEYFTCDLTQVHLPEVSCIADPEELRSDLRALIGTQKGTSHVDA